MLFRPCPTSLGSVFRDRTHLTAHVPSSEVRGRDEAQGKAWRHSARRGAVPAAGWLWGLGAEGERPGQRLVKKGSPGGLF